MALSETGLKLQPCLLLYNGDRYNLVSCVALYFVFTNHEFSMELSCDLSPGVLACACETVLCNADGLM